MTERTEKVKNEMQKRMTADEREREREGELMFHTTGLDFVGFAGLFQCKKEIDSKIIEGEKGVCHRHRRQREYRAYNPLKETRLKKGNNRVES